MSNDVGLVHFVLPKKYKVHDLSEQILLFFCKILSDVEQCKMLILHMLHSYGAGRWYNRLTVQS